MTNAVELIQKKRDGGELAAGEIEWLLGGYTGGSVTDYQMAAMAMAVFHHGLNPAELSAWTTAMLHSGETLDLSHISAPIVDKHSTGGVGDKVSIPLTPMVTACGVSVPMISGRGLGHTGGTLDKLESIPGLRTQLSIAEFTEVLENCGLVMGGQSETLVPADRKLYALRDATGTVESIPLISSSIMSKKMAEDLDGLVLDVKFGVGAFMTDQNLARRLAETMVGIGADHGVTTVALLTAMNTPLGFEVGNANEMRESIDVLKGGGPADLVELTLAIGAEMLMIGGVAPDATAARALLERARSSGRALEVFATVIAAQGGNPGVLDDLSKLPSAPQTHEVVSDRSGFVAVCDAYKVGVAAMRLGAGRERKEDTIDPGVGITLLAKPGNDVAKGEPLARLRYRHTARLEESLRVLDGAWKIADEPPSPEPLIAERISAVSFEALQAAARAIAEKTGQARHDVVAVLGSGLGSYPEDIDGAVAVPYSDIPGFPVPHVEGHAGTAYSARFEGNQVLLLAGRAHAYEGHAMETVVFAVRTAILAGCGAVLLTNAAGGCGDGMAAGDLVLISDHINLTGRNPLVGPNDSRLGSRFPDMSAAYDPALRAIAHEAARRAGTTLGEGIYAWFLGPTYETPAEVRMAKQMGAHMVGMSTVPEAIAARHMRAKVIGISLVTNLAAGISPVPLSHREVTETAAAARTRFTRLLDELLPRL